MSVVTQDLGVEVKSERLKGKKIALAVCGGIASVEVVKIIRELRRYSAAVFPFMTPSSLRFVGQDALSWASARPALVEPSFNVEYLQDYDLVLVAPATLNTISKSALGITDNLVLLLIASQIGNQKPILFVPAMNWSLFTHPQYECHRDKLCTWGAKFLENDSVEGRIKIATPEKIVEQVLGLL